jgi:hypothetical protein
LYPTVEVRWFHKGEIPPDVGRWFNEEDGDPEGQPARIDHYLRVSEGESLGVKLREGRLEIKQRYGPSEVLRFGRNSTGRVEYWRKWSFLLARAESEISRFIGTSKRWIGVRKERKLRAYKVTGKGVVSQVAISGNLDRGCGWELARIGIEGEDESWWSMGFEAFGQESELRDTLLLVAESILKMDTASRMGIEVSFGYPRWLKVIVDSVI